MISLITGGAGFFRLSLAEYFFHPKVNIEEGIKIVKKILIIGKMHWYELKIKLKLQLKTSLSI